MAAGKNDEKGQRSESVDDLRRIDLGRLENVLGFHLRMANVALYHDFSKAMEELGLTQKQVAVLELIAENEGASQIDIAATLGMDRATMMALVNRLEDRDLVERRPSPVDRRRQQLILTGAGQDMLTACRQLISAHERKFTERFSDKELKTFVGFLKRVYAGDHSD
ncbi:MarR family winged helix-turn-helix transcriptional regulator [Rhizobium rhizogenes]|uniref:MarR family winged helix-turn-helix transcriptional regulator n=1 Tax=Rhizobium rhizogenes TaxID=359 RepID=UPI00226FB7CB|nr:MarR family winged helix-turn-helix transcriptional regulator [Rhizobium rhizogenes]